MYDLVDEIRRQAGLWLDAAGLGRSETPFRIIRAMRGARLRAYGEPRAGRGPGLLIVSAPFKRPYIWDLMPEVSVVRRCLAHDLQVYLLEWSDSCAGFDALGLEDFSLRLISEAADAIEAESHCCRRSAW